MKQMIDEYNIFDEEETKYFTGLLARAVMLSQKDMNDLDAIAELGEGWVAEEALAIAVYACLKYKNSFEDAVVCAVNHPGDSDSTGAIAGNIIGAYLGIKSIPDYYLDNIELKDVITEIADDLIHPIPDSFANPHDHEYWNSKYIFANRDLTKKGIDKEDKEGNIFTKLFKRGE
jgi:ADP-ribosylglycohydrolase